MLQYSMTNYLETNGKINYHSKKEKKKERKRTYKKEPNGNYRNKKYYNIKRKPSLDGYNSKVEIKEIRNSELRTDHRIHPI